MKDRLIVVFASFRSYELLYSRYFKLCSNYRLKKLERISHPQERKRGLLAEFCLIEAIRRFDKGYPLPLQIQTGLLGKPYLPDDRVHISLSHAGEFGAAAVSTKPVGIDIERTRSVSDRLVKRICTEKELESIWLPNPTDETFRNLFSAKESVVKCSGKGIAALSSVETVGNQTIRQKFFGEYVLSAASVADCEWEVYLCKEE